MRMGTGEWPRTLFVVESTTVPLLECDVYLEARGTAEGWRHHQYQCEDFRPFTQRWNHRPLTGVTIF